jgi:hypothetical protein
MRPSPTRSPSRFPLPERIDRLFETSADGRSPETPKGEGDPLRGVPICGGVAGRFVSVFGFLDSGFRCKKKLRLQPRQSRPKPAGTVKPIPDSPDMADRRPCLARASGNGP